MPPFSSLLLLGLCCCSRQSTPFLLDHPRLYGPSEAVVKHVVEFQCEIPNPNNQSILLRLFKTGDREKVLGDSTLLNGDQVGYFPRLITQSDEGDLECEASVQNDSQILPTASPSLHLKVIEPVKGAEVVYSGPNELFEGRNLELNCTVKAGNHLSFEWRRNGQLVSPSLFHRIKDGRLLIYRATSKDSGAYRCEVTNRFNETKDFSSNSSEVVITVKDVVSEASILVSVLKEEDQNYSAVISCQTDRGHLPITFSLYRTTGLISNVTAVQRHATFKVPLVLERHMGWLQCQANNGDQTTHSRWLPLIVEKVGGPVSIQSQYDMAENYAVIGLRFYCKAAKGTHPRFQWFLNQTLLSNKGSFYYVFDQLPEQSILLLSVGRSSAGTYHCEVSDSFDNTTAISSRRHHVDKQVLNRLPVFVVAIVFGCFTLVILLVSFCCLYGALFRPRQFGDKLQSGLVLDHLVPALGDEMEQSINSEDPDEMNTPRDYEFYQESEASLDEWSDIQEERETLEDEEVQESI
uniref:Ig-like domain-containing protein n=1 Tax=Iconisemion striatum TaxID=60296 RepID=A0A1A7WDQ1_9TELE